ncbi:MAG: LanC-like protein [Rubrivivax sp.]|nr:LanC-like protein [Rubrivivax sp.]
MLFESDRHEALAGGVWDAPRVQAALRGIVADIEGARGPDGAWPVHALDEDGDSPRGGFKSLYLGRAGLLWALWMLQRAGAVTLRSEPATEIAAVHAAYLADPDTSEVVPSYFLGEVGILLAWWRMTGSAESADRLHEAVRANIPNPTNESLWAAPGTMVAAWHLWQATSEPRWRALFLANVEQLWRTWVHDEAAHCHLWTQDLYGTIVQYLGAGHGFAGNVYPLLKGASLLDAGRREALYERCAETLQALALREGDAVNWPPGTYTPRPGRPRLLMQWCHGAPGVIAATADLPPGRLPAFDALLLAAGRAVWQAGPLVKGYGLCHGTAGNGYAFLALHRRTGDAQWLDHARSFAMHALVQRERLVQATGRGRYTLWTGDAGLAVYLWHCLQGQGALPGLDLLQ